MKKFDKCIIYTVVLYLLGMLVIQDILSGQIVWKLKGHDFLASCIVGIALYLWNFNKRIVSVVVWLISFMSSILLIQFLTHTALPISNIHYMINSSSLLVSILISLYNITDSNRLGKNRLNRILFGILVFSFYLIPLSYWGYWLISGQVLQADIVLAICQTNFDEIVGYLKGQSISSLVCLFIAIIFYSIVVCLISKFMPTTSYARVISKKKVSIGLFIVFYLLNVISFVRISKNTDIFVMYKSIRQLLDSYKAYGENKAMREQRLLSLKGLTVNPDHKGVYVLVIGESETREHMGVYGYKRDTTPWLKKLSENKNTIVFNQAFSNHTHTVQSLTYALSEKNQYNDIPIDSANSIIEIAKAAGMKTYWISNQQKYSAWDTPTAEIASTADYQVWVNGSVGERSDAMYYDEHLLGQIPDIDTLDNALIVFHVMGSHGAYDDRYPHSYEVFSGDNSLIDRYDNSILYNDFVLSKLFDDVKRSPNLQAFIVFSDHGEDVETRNSHESTKYTPVMSKIPLIINFSDNYLSKNQSIVDVLRSHKDSAWTNDLMYNMMLSIMGIEGAPVVEPNLDFTSLKYDRDIHNLRTLHGKQKLSL
ncbi:phosphoethanolamine transferase [uncultured Veillonella sp.]|uniref:phosphoethanolamine transferase n=1 Tax=uncultured Veillonella sp. TaxID=159268 RepID=UPI0026118E32|nr:phosphoethanolamine transferase [uncultured Veillonella sp.]